MHVRQYLQKLEAYSRDRKRLSELEMQIVVLRALGETPHTLKHPSLMHMGGALASSFGKGCGGLYAPQGMQRLRLPAGHRNRKHDTCLAAELDMLGHVTVTQCQGKRNLVTGLTVQGWRRNPRGVCRLPFIACSALLPEEQMTAWAEQNAAQDTAGAWPDVPRVHRPQRATTN